MQGSRVGPAGGARRACGRCAHSRQLGIRPSGSDCRRSNESPSSGATLCHRRRVGRARVPSGVAARGNVRGHRSALEGLAWSSRSAGSSRKDLVEVSALVLLTMENGTPVTCRWSSARLSRCVPSGSALEGVALRHLPPKEKAQPVSNERPDAVAAGCSGGRREAAGPDAPLAARHFAALDRRGAEASVPREGRREKKSVVRPISYLGVSSQTTLVCTGRTRKPRVDSWVGRRCAPAHGW